ncbi:class I SAM-dependent methyltransferase [Oceanobacillus piezotolerans]|nr:class I SAM-dependent methyltransferase [Oceanobacillus piezotolerans]
MDNKKDVKAVFSRNKESYVKSSTHAQGNDLSLLPSWLNPTQEMSVLDIATGGGHVAKKLAPYVKTVFATDLTREMLDNTASHLKHYNNIHYVIVDAEDLPFLDNSFDIITCRIAAHHFPNPMTFIKEVQRVLKADGKFLLIDNIAPENQKYDQFINSLEKIRDYSHYRSHSVSEWNRFFKTHHLVIDKEKKNKKQLPFKEWVNRTLANKADITNVEQYILKSSEDIKKYYQIIIKDEEIQSFTIDEWMVLLKKDLSF